MSTCDSRNYCDKVLLRVDWFIVYDHLIILNNGHNEKNTKQNFTVNCNDHLHTTERYQYI